MGPREIFENAALVVALAGACGLGVLLFLVAFAAPAWDAVIRWWRQDSVKRTLAAVFTVGLILYGGSKGGYDGRITYDGGIRADGQNLVTNDTVTIRWQRDTSEYVVPLNAAVYVDYRPIAATNEEWGLLGQAVVSDWQWTGTISNATNFDYNVWAYYIPPEPVHTNGVWESKHLGDPEVEGRAVPLGTRIFINGRTVVPPERND